ncbi:MAG TPA: hypothetical protein VGG48_10620 [Rhizomicrobium sp.]|jgi:hypothetical protein
MRSNPAFWGIRAIVPVVFLGGLFFYFLHTSGSIEGAVAIGLGPTLLGLGILCLLFCIPLFYGIIRIILTRPRNPDGRGSDPDDDENTFDADAMIARYLARQAEEAAASPPPPTPRGPAPKPSSFGRKRR